MTMTAPTAAPMPSPTSTSVSGRLSFAGVFRSEWIKLLSLRSMRWSILIMILLSLGGAAMMASATASFRAPESETLPWMVVQAAGFSTTFTVLVMGVLGVLAMTSEYSSGMILSTLTAVPSRTPMFLAKALAVSALAFIVGVISVFGGGLLAALMVGHGALGAFFEPAVLASLLGATLYLVLATLLSFGIGSLLRSSAGAIFVMVALFFVSTIVLQILTLTGWDWVPVVSEWMPAALGQELTTSAIDSSRVMGVSVGAGYWPALGGLVAWAAAALIPAAILLKSRDAV